MALGAVTTLAALALAVPVVQTAGRGINRLPPSRGELALKLAVAQAKRPDLIVSDQALAAAREAAVHAPLAYEPFFVAGRAAEQKGNFAEATRLMEEVRRRRPSYAPGRILLMGYYGRAGRNEEAILEADVAMRLSGEAEKAILPVLAAMLPYPEARTALARALAADPSWRAAFLAVAANVSRPEDAAALVGELRRLKPRQGVAEEAALVVQTLVRTGRFKEARAAWLKLVNPSEAAAAGLVFDPDFRGSQAPAPFNWTLESASSGRAEIAAAARGEPAHLAASFFGEQETQLAAQTLVLAPGRYVLSVAAKADREELSGRLVWNISCLPKGPDLAALPLQRFAGGYRRYQVAFAVPAGCAAQKLTLTGQPGELTQPVNVDFAQIRLTGS